MPKREYSGLLWFITRLKLYLRSLDALSTFIQSQRTLLAQTLADIDRLHELRNEVASQPADIGMVPHFVDQVRCETLRSIVH